MKIVVTGASGYIGQRFISIALTHDHEIVAASRRPLNGISSWLPFDLNARPALSLPEGTDAVLHLAADTSDSSGDGSNELAAAKALLAAASAAGAKFIFVSSQTARKDAPTNYGRTKWRIEQEVLAASGVVVRPGQVYGGAERGLFGTLVRLVRLLVVLPAFVPPVMVQPIHVDDCANALLRFIERDGIPGGVYFLASTDPVSFTDYLRSIARYRVRRRRIYVPVPVFFVQLFIKLLGEKLSAKLGIGRLRSLFDLPPMDCAPSLGAIGLKLRTLRSGMHCSGCARRRRLIHEALTLLTYVLRSKPPSTLVRRYVRMIERLRGGEPLDLPAWLFRWPAALALLDKRALDCSISEKEFSWRVDAATVIAEASEQGAIRFLGAVQSSRPLAALAGIFLALSGELFYRLSRLIALPLLLRIKNGGRF